MSQESDTKQGKKTVIFKTFKHCPSNNTFSGETDKQGCIASLVCKACRDNLAHIRNEAKLRVIKKGSVYMDNCGDGVASIGLANVENTLKLEVYMIGLRRTTLVALCLQSQMFLSLKN